MSKPPTKKRGARKAKSPQIATPRPRPRTRGRAPEAPPEPADSDENGPYVAVDKVDPRAYVANDKDRRIIAMGRSLYMTDQQIAVQVGVSETTLKKYYRRELSAGVDAVNLTVANNMARIAASTDNKNAVSAGRFWLERFGKLPPPALAASASFSRTTKPGADDEDDAEVETFTLSLGRLPGLEDDE